MDTRMRDAATGALLLVVVVVAVVGYFSIVGGGATPAPTASPAPPAGNAADSPIVREKADAERAVAELSRRIERYRAEHGRYPFTLDELRSGGPLPDLPPGVVYKYHHLTGRLEAR